MRPRTKRKKGVKSKTRFGAWLRRERIKAGLTQKALAEKSGLSASTIANLELGNYPASKNARGALKGTLEDLLRPGRDMSLDDVKTQPRVSHVGPNRLRYMQNLTAFQLAEKVHSMAPGLRDAFNWRLGTLEPEQDRS
jgi:hypothetical protein